MKKIVLFLLFLSSIGLLAEDIVVFGDDYIVNDDKKLTLIYAKEVRDDALFANSYEREVIKNYEKSYGYELDEKLYLGILSTNNQIANAFSTQIPLNMQMDYIGGSLMVDYMASSSWLKTLLLHESAHNFQINPKKNRVSKLAHKIVGNIPVTYFFVPIFPIPNALESSFILEGNSVLNESRFNIGGRLYNGALLAMAITQARAGYITPERTYNSHLFFPYGTHHYIVGGFFQLYLAQKYGIDKVNRYFWNFSAQYLPMQTDAIFKKSFNKSYKEEISEYSRWLNQKYSGFTLSSGEVIATSKKFDKLNSDNNEIYFLTSDAKKSPKLYILSKDGNIKSIVEGDFLFGKIFKIDGKYYSLASAKTDVNRIKIALFDKDANILKNSIGKAVQRVLRDNRLLYFDINGSFDTPALYLENSFYDRANSSAFSDSDENIYYFKQEGKKRTLYKNKKPIFSYQGWYGFVVDVDENGIYFVANSQNGSSLYLLDRNKVFRLCKGDDVVDAKVLDDNNLLLTVITSNGYNFIKTSMQKSEERPFNRTYFFEKREDFGLSYRVDKSIKQKPYTPYKELKYSNLEQSILFGEDDIEFNIGANFTDPLGENLARVYISRYDDETIAGVGYENSTFRLRYGLDIYGVVEKDETISSRDFGADLFINYPIYKHVYKSLDFRANYFIDHDKSERKPLSLVLNYKDSREFGISMYRNRLNSLSLMGVADRGDFTGGVKYNYFRDLEHEFYAGLNLSYLRSDTDKIDGNYGIKIDDNIFFTNRDSAHISMPSLDVDLYAQEVFKGGISFYKVLNFSKYNFSIPISLRRESIYAKYNYYDVTFLNGLDREFSEFTVGSTFDVLFLHKNPLPISFEFIYNDKLVDDSRFRVLFDLPL